VRTSQAIERSLETGSGRPAADRGRGTLGV